VTAWRVKTWAGMARWERLCSVLDERGPMTTGALGMVKGIGENVRGIRREADRNLARYGMKIIAEETHELTADGEKINNATYRLVNLRVADRVAETSNLVEELRQKGLREKVAMATSKSRSLFGE